MNYRGGKPTVLVVEDDTHLLKLLVCILASGGSTLSPPEERQRVFRWCASAGARSIWPSSTW